MNDCLTCNEKCIYYYGEAKGTDGHSYCSRFGIDACDGLPCNSYEEPQEDTDHNIDNSIYKAMWEELKRVVQEEREFSRIDTAIIRNSIAQAQKILMGAIEYQCLDSILRTMDDIEIDYAREEKSNDK